MQVQSFAKQQTEEEERQEGVHLVIIKSILINQKVLTKTKYKNKKSGSHCNSRGLFYQTDRWRSV
jgi:hypothetical protein